MNKYLSIDLSKLEAESNDVSNYIAAQVNANGKNRSDRRRIIKALGKVQNRNQAFEKRRAEESEQMRIKYQQQLDSRIDDCQTQVEEGIEDNWLKMMSLFALTMKRKYKWNDSRIGSLLGKANDLHNELLASGEWKNILEIVDNECDIQLQIKE